MDRLLDVRERTLEAVVRTARTLASICGPVSPRALRQCFAHLFALPAECALAESFVTAYNSQREALAARPAVVSIGEAAGA